MHFIASSASISLSKTWLRPQKKKFPKEKNLKKKKKKKFPKEKSPGVSLGNSSHYTQNKMSCGESSFYLPHSLSGCCILFHAFLTVINQKDNSILCWITGLCFQKWRAHWNRNCSREPGHRCEWESEK